MEPAFFSGGGRGGLFLRTPRIWQMLNASTYSLLQKVAQHLGQQSRSATHHRTMFTHWFQIMPVWLLSCCSRNCVVHGQLLKRTVGQLRQAHKKSHEAG